MKKVLFIDDDEHILKALNRYLNSCAQSELHFEKCTDKEQAINAIKKIQPDLIFLDHNLSRGMKEEGLEIMQFIAENISCEVVSMSSEQEYGVKYQKYGVEWIRKGEARKIEEKINKY